MITYGLDWIILFGKFRLGFGEFCSALVVDGIEDEQSEFACVTDRQAALLASDTKTMHFEGYDSLPSILAQ